VVVPKIWDCAPQGGSLSGLHCCLTSGACSHGEPPRARWCCPATFEFVCFDPGNLNVVVVGSTLIESLQISRLKTKSLLSAEIETTTQVIACAWE